MDITGTNSSETLNGTGDADLILGRGGNDVLNGNGGNDILDGGLEDDTLTGGAGDDIFRYSARQFDADVITDLSAGDRIDLSALNIADFGTLQRYITQLGADSVITLGYNSDDEKITIRGVLPGQLNASFFIFNTSGAALSVTGTSFIDVLFGGNGNDTITANNGNDTLNGGAGDDRLIGAEGNDTLIGGAGNDVFAYVARSFDDDLVLDFAAGDRIDLTGLNVGDFATLQRYISQSGTDTVLTFGYGTQTETITLRGVLPGALTASSFIFNTATTALSVNGTSFRDVLFGGNGNDTITANDGNDTLNGGAGDDILMGHEDDDTLIGGLGNDLFAYRARAFDDDVILDFTAGDRIDLTGLNIGDFATLQRYISQSGTDTVLTFGWGTGSETITIKGIAPAQLTAASFLFNSSTNGLTVAGTSFQDVLFGGNGNDIINAGNGNDTLNGGIGNDTLNAAEGNDTLLGGVGNDRLTGAQGNDTINGGNGIDTAVFAAALSSYTVTFQGSDVLIASSAEGSDRVSEVEFFEFAGTTYSRAQLRQMFAPGDEFILTATAGVAATVQGHGIVAGSAGLQNIVVRDMPGRIVFDGSFNQGGDRIVLSGNAGAYTTRRSGSSVEISDGDTVIVVPAGERGADIVFADGVRTITVDLATGTLKLGSQTVTATATAITAPAGTPTATGAADPAAIANLSLFADGTATAGGNLRIFGTAGTDYVTVLAGSRAQLDGSFNQGGDTLVLAGTASSYTAVRSGSAVVLTRGDEQITMPVGFGQLTVRFADSDRALRFDADAGAPKLGNDVITTTPTQLSVVAAVPGDTAFGEDSGMLALGLPAGEDWPVGEQPLI